MINDFFRSFRLTNYSEFFKRTKTYKLFYLFGVAAISIILLIRSIFVLWQRSGVDMVQEAVLKVLAQNIPDDLVVTLSNDVEQPVKINKSLPYFVPINISGVPEQQDYPNLKYILAVADPNDEANPKDYNAYIVIKGPIAFAMKDDGTYDQLKISEVTNQLEAPMIMDKTQMVSTINNGIDQLTPKIYTAFIEFCLIFTCLLIFVVFVMFICFIAFTSSINYLVQSIMHKGTIIKYSSLYTIGIFVSGPIFVLYSIIFGIIILTMPISIELLAYAVGLKIFAIIAFVIMNIIVADKIFQSRQTV